MKQFANRFRRSLGQILCRPQAATKIRQSTLQLEQLEDRYLLAGDPFTVLSTEFV